MSCSFSDVALVEKRVGLFSPACRTLRYGNLIRLFFLMRKSDFLKVKRKAKKRKLGKWPSEKFWKTMDNQSSKEDETYNRSGITITWSGITKWSVRILKSSSGSQWGAICWQYRSLI